MNERHKKAKSSNKNGLYPVSGQCLSWKCQLGKERGSVRNYPAGEVPVETVSGWGNVRTGKCSVSVWLGKCPELSGRGKCPQRSVCRGSVRLGKCQVREMFGLVCGRGSVRSRKCPVGESVRSRICPGTTLTVHILESFCPLKQGNTHMKIYLLLYTLYPSKVNL